MKPIPQKPDHLHELRNQCVEYRAVHKLTQAEMGKKLGVGLIAVNRFENGKTNLRADVMATLLEVLKAWRTSQTKPDQYHTHQCRRCLEHVPLYINNIRAAYCTACGEPIGQICRRCGQINRYNADYCEACGLQISQQGDLPKRLLDIAREAEAKYNRAPAPGKYQPAEKPKNRLAS